MSKGLRTVGLVILFCCIGYAGEPKKNEIAKNMRKAVAKRLSTRNLSKSEQKKALHAWESVITKAVSETDIKQLDSDERKRILKNFSDYLTFGDIGNVYPARVKQWEEQIAGGLRSVASGKGLLTDEEVAKLKRNTKEYKRRCADVLREYLRKADRFAMSQDRWSAIKSAYFQAAKSHWGAGYSMTDGQRQAYDQLTIEMKNLRWQYAKLFIYTQIMQAFCNRISMETTYTTNIFLQHNILKKLHDEQRQILIDGIPNMEKRIRLQLDDLLSQGTFYFPGPTGRLGGYWDAALLSEKEIAQKTSFDLKKTVDWVIIEKVRCKNNVQNAPKKR